MLVADVFNHLPRPLVLGLYDAVLNNTNDNPLQCDDELCWLKHEEQQGNFTWFAFNGPTWSFKAFPRCTNGTDWSHWSCDETG